MPRRVECDAVGTLENHPISRTGARRVPALRQGPLTAPASPLLPSNAPLVRLPTTGQIKCARE